MFHLPPSHFRGPLVGLIRRTPDLARLRPSLADGFHILHPVANLEIVEVVVQQAVAVEPQLAAFRGPQETVVLPPTQTDDLADQRRVVLLALAALALL